MTALNRMDALVYGENCEYCCGEPVSAGAGSPEDQIKDRINALFKESSMKPRDAALRRRAEDLLAAYTAHMASGVKAPVPQPVYPLGIRRP
jgi:hypothetical protein